MPRYRSSISSLKEDTDTAHHSRKSFSTDFRRKVREESITNKRTLRDASNITKNLLFNRNIDRLNQDHVLAFQEKLQDLQSSDPEILHAALEDVRKRISFSSEPPVDEAIAAGIVPYIINSASLAVEPRTAFEATWVLTNIASGSKKQSLYLLDNGALFKLADLLTSPHQFLRDQALWAVGNIAGDLPQVRDYTINSNVLTSIFSHIKSGLNDEMASNAIWALSNFCRGKNPKPDYKLIKNILPIASSYLDHGFNRIFPKSNKAGDDEHYDNIIHSENLNKLDFSILHDALITIAHLLEANGLMEDKIKDFTSLEPDLYLKILNLLKITENNSVVRPAIRIIGALSRAPIMYPDFLNKYETIISLYKFLSNGDNKVIRDSAWALSNICSQNPDAVKFCLSKNVLDKVCEIFNGTSAEAKSELILVILNVVNNAREDDLAFYFNKHVLMTILTMVRSKYFNAKKMGLTILKILLKRTVGFMKDGKHPFVEMLKECKGIDIIEGAQEDSNDYIYKLSSEIIREYFGGEEEDPEELLKHTVY